jgi:hypothetical protein
MSLKFTAYFAKTLKAEVDEGVVRGPGDRPSRGFPLTFY